MAQLEVGRWKVKDAGKGAEGPRIVCCGMVV